MASGKESELLKDQFKDGINHYNERDQKKWIGEVARICRIVYSDGSCNKETLEKELKLYKYPETKPRNPQHKCCKRCETGVRTEKRICRCMYYFNRSEQGCGRANGCEIFQVWKNVGEYKVIEFEWPMDYKIEHVGGIDLILQKNEEDEIKYGVEVKPWYNTETLSRMIVEALTYTCGREYKPAIAVFEYDMDSDSKKTTRQYREIKSFRKEEDKDWKEIEEHISIFIIHCNTVKQNIEGTEREVVEFEFELLNPGK